MQKRKEQDRVDSPSDDLLPLTINLETDVPRDQLRVIDQYLPDPSTLGDAVLIPRSATQRIAGELNFAREQSIDEYSSAWKDSRQPGTTETDEKKQSSGNIGARGRIEVGTGDNERE